MNLIMKDKLYFLKRSIMLNAVFKLVVLWFFMASCDKIESNEKKVLKGIDFSEVKPLVHEGENNIKTRFSPPDNYIWVEETPNSFGAFLVDFPLKSYGTKILKFDGSPISNQSLHEAVYDIDIGEKDLQQCADSVIRLYAEYLWKQDRKSEIAFHFTNGDLVKWIDYRDGYRAFVEGNRVDYKKVAAYDESYQNFRSYLDLIFNYAGTISLTRESKAVPDTQYLKTGDILITPGSPGHVVFIAGVCENKKGEKLFLLSEGFTPAQSIHLLKNPFDSKRSPWYALDVNAARVSTARFIFSPVNFRSVIR